MKIQNLPALKENSVEDQWLTMIVRFWNDTDEGIRLWTKLATMQLVTGGFSSGVTTVSGAYTLTSTDQIVLVNSTAGSVTITLPTAAGIKGQQYRVINIGTHFVTISTTSSQTINGGSSYSLPSKYYSVSFLSDGSNWYAV